jgi:UDPglucose 6-dehydrogenase
MHGFGEYKKQAIKFIFPSLIMECYRVGVVGGGFVGGACKLLQCDAVSVFVFDLDLTKRYSSDPSIEISDNLSSFVQECKCDVIFVCVPTPMRESDGGVYTKVVEDVVNEIKACNAIENQHIIVRSTVPPGTCERLGVSFMPEFLTEKNALKDFKQTKHWIVGRSGGNKTPNKVSNILRLSKFYGKIDSDNIIYTPSNTAEMCKYMRNAFLAAKVSFCNEFKTLSDTLGIQYHELQTLFGLDARIGPSHTEVPGPDGFNGFGGTCFPKDMNGIQREFKRNGLDCPILEAALYRNNKLDRPQKDYLMDKGRAIVNDSQT